MIDPLLPGASLAPAALSRWQVVQQGPDGTASIPLWGRYRTVQKAFSVEARVVWERDGRPVDTGLDWRPARLDEEGDGWRLDLAGVPAGGLYRVECRVVRPEGPDRRPMRGDFVHHLGVGDLWVIAGQSNASGTGLGPVEDPPTLGVHLFGNDERWQLACHPLEDATTTLHPVTVHGVFQAHSPWLAFGRRLMETLGHPIGLIPTALGGSPLALWEPAAAGPLYDNLLSMVRAAGGRVRGMVWYQGESDAQGGTVSTYAPRFRAFVETLRADLGQPDLPILCAQLGRYVDRGEPARAAAWTAMREVQRQLAAGIPNTWLIPAIDLPLSDEIHLSAASNVQLGHRFADQALREVYHRPARPPALRLESAVRTAPDRAVLQVTAPPAGWCRPGPIHSLTTEDDAGDLPVREVHLHDDGRIELELARAVVGLLRVHAHAGCHPPADLRDADQRPVEAFSVEVPVVG